MFVSLSPNNPMVDFEQKPLKKKPTDYYLFVIFSFLAIFALVRAATGSGRETRGLSDVTVGGVLGVVARDGGVFKIANEGLARQALIGSTCCNWC